VVASALLHWFAPEAFWPDARRVLSRAGRLVAFERIPQVDERHPVARFLLEALREAGLARPKAAPDLEQLIRPGARDFELLSYETWNEEMLFEDEASYRGFLQSLCVGPLAGRRAAAEFVETAPFCVPCRVSFASLEIKEVPGGR
jgi:hypothetical protein